MTRELADAWAGAAYAATGLDLVGPWGWAGHAATTLVGGIVVGFTVEAMTETVYDYVTKQGVKPGMR
ncbi:MAG: hypothetical protein IPK11_14450 [Ignavibacteria bacterium]|nr:hypothetical protein [Ignavibacteria bacterium]